MILWFCITRMSSSFQSFLSFSASFTLQWAWTLVMFMEQRGLAPFKVSRELGCFVFYPCKTSYMLNNNTFSLQSKYFMICLNNQHPHTPSKYSNISKDGMGIFTCNFFNSALLYLKCEQHKMTLNFKKKWILGAIHPKVFAMEKYDSVYCFMK